MALSPFVGQHINKCHPLNALLYYFTYQIIIYFYRIVLQEVETVDSKTMKNYCNQKSEYGSVWESAYERPKRTKIIRFQPMLGYNYFFFKVQKKKETFYTLKMPQNHWPDIPTGRIISFTHIVNWKNPSLRYTLVLLSYICIS